MKKVAVGCDPNAAALKKVVIEHLGELGYESEDFGSDDPVYANATPQTIQWIDEVERKLSGKRVLLVDEVDDSRVTLQHCLLELLRHGPREIAVMVLHNTQKEKRGALPQEVRHYFAGETMADRWICYPWDADDIDAHERSARPDRARSS